MKIFLLQEIEQGVVSYLTELDSKALLGTCVLITNIRILSNAGTILETKMVDS